VRIRPGGVQEDLALITDLYELTMLQAYWAEGMRGRAVFSLFFRNLPVNRNFMLACGQQHAAQLAMRVRFGRHALALLAETGLFRDEFLRHLEDFRFSGDIYAMPEGTPVFPQEPLLEVEAPIHEAQLLESLLMNYVHLETVLASKAVRLVRAAGGRPVVDFGLRRMHGQDAAIRGVRAFCVAGIEGTSHVFGGLRYGLPLRGTMAHSFVQAYENEDEAFRAYARLYPGTTLLVDTYDTLNAVDKIVRLAREEGDRFRIGAIRLDSGDIGALAFAVREKLDAAGLDYVKIFASGGLDEKIIAELLAIGAPVDAFGVGSSLGTAADSPVLDLAYKLTQYGGEPRLKRSPGKAILPGAKQVYRFEDERQGVYQYDEIALRHEKRRARPLLMPAVRAGESVVDYGRLDPHRARRYAQEELSRLPQQLLSLAPAEAGYEIRFSGNLQKLGAAALKSRGGTRG
jgi:nicotinate phosphoribosyltransferase